MNNAALNWFKSSYSDGSGGDCIEVAYEWRKSSYSSGEGGECLEVAYDWCKSSYSSGEGGDCVEVAAHPTTIHIRDSKLAEASPHLGISPAAWTAFVAYAPQIPK
ncbi:DUF397 domain-containing protein [Streptomyces sp. NBC_00237]|uniref:DUF397 domain-containing protein n=1 Tax=Streptomyces sp. NBC_00237 TaxID=2975687 RepID=UPI00224CF234|nr:DUF397 domain-containing protein [Streptomyces sp. NBC_00237]MCX5204979.1 DUF397 domain-containing protein [Streptomyces sp. NBC_00237]